MQFQARVRTFVRLPRLVLIGLIRAYRMVLSPYLPAACRYTPTCSAYAIQALRKYGVVKGVILSVYRIVRCNPWGGHGYDPPRWFGESRPATASPPTHEIAHAHELRNP